MSDSLQLSQLYVSRNKEQFLLELLRELVGNLEDIVGLEDSEGFISLVGNKIGNMMNDEYREFIGVKKCSNEQIASILIDLKRRIQGNFSIESICADKIILINDKCPFSPYEKQRTSLCMMTSNVFGRIVAENNDYANVEIDQALAKGDHQCRIIISLTPPKKSNDKIREYYSNNKSLNV